VKLQILVGMREEVGGRRVSLAQGVDFSLSPFWKILEYCSFRKKSPFSEKSLPLPVEISKVR